MRELKLTNGRHVGDLVTRRFRAEVRVLRSSARAAFEVAGLEADFDGELSEAFSRATRELSKKRVRQLGLEFHKPSRDCSVLVRLDAGVGVEKDTRGAARITLSSGALAIEYRDGLTASARKAAESAAELFESAFQYERDHVVTYDVTRAIEAAATRAGAITLNGNLYWLPTDGDRDLLRRLSRVVAELRLGELLVIPQFDSPEGRETIASAIGSALENELDSVVAELRELQRRIESPEEGDRRVTRRSLDSRMAKLAELESKAARCRAMLEARGDVLRSAIESAREQVLAMLTD